MKNFSRRGFTMIELLIVIGVLGILATGVLAAVDPFEQLKKARDTNNRQSAISLQTAFVRYYATHGQLPWDNTAVAATCDPANLFGTTRGDTAAAVSGAMMEACIGLLEGDGELKTGFVGALGAVADTMYVNSPAAASVSVCFAPTSKSVFAEDNTKFDKEGDDNTDDSPTATCTAASKAAGTETVDDAVCFYCAK